MPHSSFDVALAERSYAIHIGANLIERSDLLAQYLNKQVMIVTNTTVAPLYVDAVRQSICAASPESIVETLELPDGEQYKTLETLNTIFDALLESGFNRKSVIVALGGGVVGDMAGFAAASYQRGIPFIQLPTTLLSQVDSSVGGKTGVNHPLGKNMIGAFYQPEVVVIDTNVLASLPERELSAGIAEVVKYGLIADAQFFEWLEMNMTALLAKDKKALEYAVYRSCELKAEVVSEDEKEAGRRAILNLGHTYGHAIESYMGYGHWLHGEAVAAGMVMACELSGAMGWLDKNVTERTRVLLGQAKLPCDPPSGMKRADFERYMKRDKKNVDGQIRLVLLEGCGQAVVTSEYSASSFNAQLEAL